MKMFEDVTEGIHNYIFDPDQRLIETESAITLWIISGLNIRHQKKFNSQVEEDNLYKWINSSEINKNYTNGYSVWCLWKKYWYGTAHGTTTELQSFYGIQI